LTLRFDGYNIYSLPLPIKVLEDLPMGKNIVGYDDHKKHPVPAVFEHLGLKNIKPSDELTLVFRNGLLEASVKHKSGLTETATKHIGSGGFHEMTSFDPHLMSKNERDDLIRSKHAKGERQSALAKTFGLSQAMISKIVRS
jgi:hypothetical protein